VQQVTRGDFDVNDLVGFTSNSIIVSRRYEPCFRNLFFDLKKNTWKQITNTATYDSLALSKTERRYVTTTDGKKMLVWVILPPNFDAKKVSNTFILPRRTTKRLDAILFFPLEFSANGRQWLYCCSTKSSRNARPRVEWNEQISKDWGGQVMDDYLSAIDDISKESYVDNARLGCVGASYGGYSAYLAGIHNNRFKTFIAHDGVFNTQSMFGTEEVFFSNWDLVVHIGRRTML
jgi:hypothetical protein